MGNFPPPFGPSLPDYQQPTRGKPNGPPQLLGSLTAPDLGWVTGNAHSSPLLPIPFYYVMIPGMLKQAGPPKRPNGLGTPRPN